MEQPQRKSPRIAHFDYASSNYYFVTICTRDKRFLFGSPNQLNRLGTIARDDLLAVSSHYPDVEVLSYVVMPNHIHAIFAIGCNTEEGISPSLNTVVGQYKSGVARKLRKICPDLDVWQRSYYDSVIRNERAYLEALQYIENNPLKWELSKEI